MKKLVLLITFIVWMLLPLAAGVKAVFPYNYPSKKTLMNLVMENSAKGKAYGDYLLYAVNLGLADTTLTISRENISTLFNNLFSEEFILEEGKYMNSGYDSIFQKMVPSIGHKRQGFVWTFRIGTYTIRLIKADCGNILITKVIRTKVSIPSTISTTVTSPVPERVYTPQKQERSVVVYDEPEQVRVERIVIKKAPSPKREVKIGKIVIPIGVMLVAGISILATQNRLNKVPYTPYRDNTRNPGSRGQDPPPTNDEGGPVDPPPSGN